MKYNTKEFMYGRRLFLALLSLPKDASESVKAGFAYEAERVRETTLEEYMGHMVQELFEK